ncbi:MULTISPECIES: SDR family NAD(P)-dependent oxidoreductase [Sphingobium]|uniref:SDR family NAD(P)-dependent oxidoreductase n=1 Tax=Sphingobium sp. MI1205 TaxID=407020 RepID=UPI00076FE3E4|nr:SDR family NAD(P)-dependent oxidoreductase [Sphingobium sp. MI1205]AMK19979.1 putative 3-oxoacyl-[acyl-carrier-protein] reductase [Sphingobium sp. MI1205]
MTGLNTKRLLIVGAASGIGRATAALAAQAGARLALLDRNGGELQDVVAEGASPPFTCEVDLLDRDGIIRSIDAAADAMNGIDALIVTAGVGSVTPFEQQEEDDWNRTLEINLTGCFRACKAALGHLRKSPAGSIVLVASATGLLPATRGQTAYAASKAGLIGFARALSQELAPQIRVNTVCPGPVDTPLLPEMFRERLKQPGSGYPMQRAAEAEEIARLILFLAGDESSYINGSSIAIDGGRSLH